MKTFNSFTVQAVLLVLEITLVHPSFEISNSNDLPVDLHSQIADVISRGVAQFTLNLDEAIESMRIEKGVLSHSNLIFSPTSLTSTLATVMLGSNGATFDEMAKILGLDSLDISKHSERIHQIFGEMMKVPETQNNNGSHPIYASGTFVQKGFVIRDEFKKASQDIYGTEVVNLDFEQHSEAAKTIINKWVNDNTMGKIPSIIGNPLGPETQVVFASALYFCGEWRQHFFEHGTKRKPFTIEPSINKTVHVDMMFNGGKFPFHEDNDLGVKVLGLPYKGSNITMYILLPSTPGASSLQSMKKKLTVNIIEDLVANMKIRECIIGVPSMKLSSTFNMRRSLQLLGVTSLFDPKKADLSLLASGSEQKKKLSPKHHSLNKDTDSSNDKSTHAKDNVAHGDKVTQSVDDESDVNVQTHMLQDEVFHLVDDIQKADNDARPWTWRPTGIKLSLLYTWIENFGLWARLEKTLTISAEPQRLKRAAEPDDVKTASSDEGTSPNYGIDKLRAEGHLMNPEIFADDVLHKVEVTINEKGTEAAASTVVVMNRSGDFKKFIADSPFLFFIRDDRSKLILFWGSINTPVPSYS